MFVSVSVLQYIYYTKEAQRLTLGEHHTLKSILLIHDSSSFVFCDLDMTVKTIRDHFLYKETHGMVPNTVLRSRNEAL